MAFPPVFTDVWDVTQPPDTQQANLLGQDLRNLKLDIMQRMSLLSGTTANMPTPETVNATWGGAGFGLLFFATDTGIIWQWNGAAWVNITTNFFSQFRNIFIGGAVTMAVDVTLDTIYSGTVPAGVLGTNGGLRGEFSVTETIAGGEFVTISVSFGGTTLLTFNTGGGPGTSSYHASFFIINTSATTQVAVGTMSNVSGGGGFTFAATSVAGAVNTAVSQNLLIQAQKGVATDPVTFQGAYATLL